MKVVVECGIYQFIYICIFFEYLLDSFFLLFSFNKIFINQYTIKIGNAGAFYC